MVGGLDDLWLSYVKEGEREARAPTMVVAVSTSMPQYKALYSQARELGEYMLSNMKFKKVGTLYSSAFPPEVLVREDGVATLPACGFYLFKGKKNLILFAGDTSPMEDQYGFARELLRRAKEFGVKEIYSIGTRWAENPLPAEADPEANGFATERVGVSSLKKHGVKVLKEEPAPFFSSMVVAMAKDYGMLGYKLSVDHGESSPHVRSVAKLLSVLSAMAGFEVDLDDLRAKAKAAAPPRQGGSTPVYQ